MGDGTDLNQEDAGKAFAEVTRLMQKLRGPGGCPWDREQTFDSIMPYTLEEVYEVFDTIDRRAWPDLRDELGDLLLQVIFYAQIAADEGHFTMTEVVEGLTAKLVRRHPHVFGSAVARTAEDVGRTWENVKRAERAAAQAEHACLLDRVPRFVPALMEAQKLGSAAAKVGFDWPDASALLDKVNEEVQEVRAELTLVPNASHVDEELGDLLFTVVSVARRLNVDPERALRKASAKFRRRFGAMEAASGRPLQDLPLDELDVLWNRAKEEETRF